MLSNAYFLAKFRFDTAEKEPAKNVQFFRKTHFRTMHLSEFCFADPEAWRMTGADLAGQELPRREEHFRQSWQLGTNSNAVLENHELIMSLLDECFLLIVRFG